MYSVQRYDQNVHRYSIVVPLTGLSQWDVMDVV